MEDSVTVTAIRPGQWHALLSLLTDTDLVIRRLADEGTVVSGVGDRLCSWEHLLASEAAAKKRGCPWCKGDQLMPVSCEQGGVRSVYTYCLVCKRAVTPIVDRDSYDRLEFLAATEHIPRVPPDRGEALSGAISWEDFVTFLGQLPNQSAPGPDGIPYELWKGAPEPLRRALFECVNAVLERKANPTRSWLGGLIRFLFKKGDLLDMGSYRPVCLQDTAYKVLSAILTDRLYRLAERHGLLDPSQEGFRRLHSTQRQVHWAFEAAAERREKLYCCYLDFANAFNSDDHEALWRWLRELNVPDIDLLQALYEAAYYEADLSYGRSAPICLERGQKQGDKLSPLLFGLIFNALLLALKATNIGHRTISGLRTPSRGFTDDLTLVTSSALDMSRLLCVVSNFCEWSGMRIKLRKSVITAFDFEARRE